MLPPDTMARYVYYITENNMKCPKQQHSILL